MLKKHTLERGHEIPTEARHTTKKLDTTDQSTRYITIQEMLHWKQQVAHLHLPFSVVCVESHLSLYSAAVLWFWTGAER